MSEDTFSDKDSDLILELVKHVNIRLDEANPEKPMAVCYNVIGLVAAENLIAAAQEDFDLTMDYMPKLIDAIRRVIADRVSYRLTEAK